MQSPEVRDQLCDIDNLYRSYHAPLHEITSEQIQVAGERLRQEEYQPVAGVIGYIASTGGQVLRLLEERTLNEHQYAVAGPYIANWDCLDEQQEIVPNGVMLYRPQPYEAYQSQEG